MNPAGLSNYIANMSTAEVIGYMAVLVNIGVYSMKTMIPLRILAIITNCLFITYSIFAGIYPTLVLNCILLPLNITRLVQMRRLITKVKVASQGDLNFDWLKPFSRKRHYDPGQVLFSKGDIAKEMFYVVSGRFRLRELNVEIAAGAVIGELGFLAPGNARTQTIDCLQGGEVLVITYDETRQLIFQNPSFGLYFMQLSSARLFNTIERLEKQQMEVTKPQPAPESYVHLRTAEAN